MDYMIGAQAIRDVFIEPVFSLIREWVFVMIIILCMLNFADLKIDHINLKNHNFADPNFISFHRVADRVLVIGTMGHQIALIDADGKLVAKVDHTNANPDQWQSPRLLGVTGDRIYLSVFDKEVVAVNVKVFDHQLKAQKSSYPPLTTPALAGSVLSKDAFLLFTFGNAPHALTHVALEDGAWQVKREMILIEYGEPQQEGFAGPPKSYVTTHHGRAFVWKPPLMGQDRYQIDIYAINGSGKEEQVMALQNEIGDLAGFEGSWPYLMSACRFGEGYATLILLADPETFEPKGRWLEIFNAQGELLERRKMSHTTELKPLAGTNQSLVLDNTSMVLKSF